MLNRSFSSVLVQSTIRFQYNAFLKKTLAVLNSTHLSTNRFHVLVDLWKCYVNIKVKWFHDHSYFHICSLIILNLDGVNGWVKNDGKGNDTKEQKGEK